MVKSKDDSTPSDAERLARFSGDPDFMLSLARGLLVLRAFEREPRLTIARAALLTGLPRPAARRCLYTLEQLGYLTAENGGWVLRPLLLSLARTYLTSTRLAETAQPFLDRLRDELGESCSIGVLDGDEIVYIARAETRRIISIALSVGSRLPAYCTSMGRVLLAALDRDQRRQFLDAAPFAARTPYTRTGAAELEDLLDRVGVDGFALIDQEMELGLRSIAVPIRDRSGRVVAAANVGVAAHRADAAELRTRLLPALTGMATALRNDIA
ncbi:IclR family pca regulon transcriptional regulator [Endobacter medicaginis]|uniref:IclR family pca regulon transcriptional regulator n=2 Tax=Endobacter medicaginis TaxID=1181271 RepID=A0A839UZD6_9PROT|nr:IclR family transcriptional regulator C-terminal domain-containing protein [Endobacter medicaginis]MBB3173985.1 IclR family pca regulon transcriptional regulator [Endobacter medicaginis]MCX5475157.1 helix-turn-helix domain-containing protein [Endobacter medicaginis]